MSVSAVKIIEGCTLCGLCEQICPEVFKMGDTIALVIDGADLIKSEEKIREAAQSCPVNVIEVLD